jgi:hypothetical protein
LSRLRRSPARHHYVRHKLGFGYAAKPHQKYPLPFFNLLPSLTTDHPTHNRALYSHEGSGQEFFYGFHWVMYG